MTSRATEPAVADAPTPHPGARHPGQVVAFVITLHVRAGKEAEFLRLLRPVLDAMRHEPTFINAVLHRDPDDPTRFMLYETWADLDAVVQVQIHRDYRKAYLDRLPDLLRSARRSRSGSRSAATSCSRRAATTPAWQSNNARLRHVRGVGFPPMRPYPTDGGGL